MHTSCKDYMWSSVPSKDTASLLYIYIYIYIAPSIPLLQNPNVDQETSDEGLWEWYYVIDLVMCNAT